MMCTPNCIVINVKPSRTLYQLMLPLSDSHERPTDVRAAFEVLTGPGGSPFGSSFVMRQDSNAG